MIFGAKIQTFLFWKSWKLRLKYQNRDIWFSNTVKIDIVEKSRQLSICIAVSKLSVFCYRVSVLVSGRKGDVIWHWFHSVKGTSKKIVRSLMISIGLLACYWQKGYLSHPFGEMWQGCIITSNTRLMQRIGKLRDTNRGKNFGPLRKRPIKAGSPTINWTFCSLRARPHFDLGRPFFLQICEETSLWPTEDNEDGCQKTWKLWTFVRLQRHHASYFLPYEAKILQMWKWTLDHDQKCIRCICKPGRYLGNYLMNELKV